MPEQALLEIVRLTPDDWRIYRELRVAALTTDAYAFGSTLERELKFAEPDFRIRLEQRPMFVARVDGQHVGLVGGLLPEVRGSAELISMWVDPRVRGRGVGDALVRAVLDWARGMGYGEVRLWVTEGNETAERLYARNCFVPTGEKQNIRPDDPDRLEVGMVCHLHEF